MCVCVRVCVSVQLFEYEEIEEVFVGRSVYFCVNA